MMAAFNRFFMSLLAIIAVLPLAVALVMSLSPFLLVLVIVFGVAVAPRLRRGLWSAISGIADVFGSVFGFLLGDIGPPRSRSRLMGAWERCWRLSSGNRGLLVDGRSARLTEQATEQSVLIHGGMGTGKSSTFVMPNLLLPPPNKASLVITDTSGEIYRHTSGWLRRAGYRIRVLNLMEPSRSETWNPMDGMTKPQEIAELAKILIAASSGVAPSSDPFWSQSAEKLLRLLTQCLVNQPDPRYQTLASLRHLVVGFDAHLPPATPGQLSRLDRFVLNATAQDPTTLGAYRAFVQGNLKTIQSVLMSADVALDALATPEIATLTGSSTLDLAELRQRKTALFVLVNQTQMDLYGFLLSLFYTRLFATLLQNERNPGRSVWLFLDEFGHLALPSFEVFATTARKYRVSFAIFLQSLAQLDSRYGPAKARIIREGLGTEIHLPGMPLDAARDLEARIGRRDNGALIPAADLIQMKEGRALMLLGNRPATILRTRKYFERRELRARARTRPVARPHSPNQPPLLIPI